MKVLISGASIAGPALALLLGRAGYQVTVVERAPRLREGGYAVDFRGPAHLDTLAKMDVLEDLQRLETGGGAMRFVDARGRTRLFMPAEFAGGDLEVRRADISRVLYAHRGPNVRYLLGDSVRALRQFADRIEVDFEGASTASFDFVFGADGIHSNIRRLAFPGQSFERDLGYYVVGWDAPEISATMGETVCFNVPGRMIGIAPPGRDGTPQSVLAMFASPPLGIGRDETAKQKDLLREIFGGLGWRSAELLASLNYADDLFFNAISRAKVPTWFTGRVALVGDAAGGMSIGGMGTGSAIVGAYVLAGELLTSPDNYSSAFSRYQARVFPFADSSASNGEGSGKFLAPKSALGLFLRNTIFSLPPMKRWMIRVAQRAGETIEIPDYNHSSRETIRREELLG